MYIFILLMSVLTAVFQGIDIAYNKQLQKQKTGWMYWRNKIYFAILFGGVFGSAFFIFIIIYGLGLLVLLMFLIALATFGVVITLTYFIAKNILKNHKNR